jgi:hypothetical protein
MISEQTNTHAIHRLVDYISSRGLTAGHRLPQPRLGRGPRGGDLGGR